MKELKDIIVLKKGDIIEFENGYKFMLDKDNYTKVELECYNREYGDITKVERPTQYETIYEAPKQILDKEEKIYLENIIRPFKNKVNYITKEIRGELLKEMSYISIVYDDGYAIDLPDFKEDTMYKGMELNKEYTLNELGLFA